MASGTWRTGVIGILPTLTLPHYCNFEISVIFAYIDFEIRVIMCFFVLANNIIYGIQKKNIRRAAALEADG